MFCYILPVRAGDISMVAALRRLNITPLLLIVLAGAALGVVVAIDAKIAVAVLVASIIIVCCFALPNVYILFTMLYIILVPKIAIVNVPGTYVGIRGEDLLIGLFVVKLLYSTKMQLNFKMKRVKLLFILYALSCLLSVLYGLYQGFITNPLLGFMFLFRKIEYFSLIYFGYIYFQAKDRQKTFFRLADVSVVLLLLIGMLQQFGHFGAFTMGQYQEVVSGRIMSTFSGPYEYSAFLVCVTPLYIYRLCKSRGKMLWVSYLAIIGYSILLTEARISLIAFMAILLLGLWKLIRSAPIKLFLLTCLVSNALVGGLLLTNSEQLQTSDKLKRFETLDVKALYEETVDTFTMRDYQTYLITGPQLYYQGSDLSYSMRMSKWSNLLDGMFHNPIFGLGPSTTGEAVDGNYVRYLAESGLLGFMLWLLLIGYILTLSRSLMRKRVFEGYLIYLNIVAMLIIALFIDIFESSKVAMLLWFMIGWMMVKFDINGETRRNTSRVRTG